VCNIFLVSAGMGWNTNSTIFIVDDHVTWYAAAQLCKETYDADFEFKGRTNFFIVKSLINSNE
jgi:hypothetical protein